MALAPAKLSDFALEGPLGSGTSARVHGAIHKASGRPVAIKMLEASDDAPLARERFAREAVLLAGVSSRHVNELLAFGFEKGEPFLVLERLEGETLDAKLRRDGPVPLPTALDWIEQLIVGVRDCHDANVIHRDIKPSNVFVHAEAGAELVKLIDFGVARLRELHGEPTGLTASGHVLGSMGYMAPEQFRDAKSVTFAADIYAIGVLVFRTLTGRLPFVERTFEALVRMKSERPVPPVSSMPGMPRSRLLDGFVTRATQIEPKARFASVREMLEHWWNVMASLDEDATTDVMRRGRRSSRAISVAEVEAPDTVSSPAPSSPDDQPTSRNNAGLAKLVEQELQLSKWRTEDPESGS